MAREASITPEQVYAVADAIKAEGNKPTSRAVRERLGNIGSMGTINRLLQQWKSSHERKSTSALALPVPLQNAILDFMEVELAGARATLEAELIEQQQEAADLAGENERQTETIDRLNEQIAGLSEDRAAAEGKAAQLAVDLEAAHAEATAERQAAELARTELAKALLRLEAMPRLLEDLESARAEIAAERATRVEAEQSAAVLRSQKDDLQSRLSTLAETIDGLRHELAQVKAGAEAEAARMRDESAKALQQQRSEAGERLAETKAAADAEVTRLRDEAAKALQQQRSEAAERLVEARAELSRTLEMLDQTQKTVDTLNAALNTATVEARRSAEEAAELRGRQSGTGTGAKPGPKDKGKSQSGPSE